LDGGSIRGQLVELDADHVALETATGRVSVAADKLVALKAETPAQLKEKAAGSAELTDRSSLAFTDYSTKGGVAHLTLAGGAKAQLPTRGIRWVRFRGPSNRDERLAKQWAEMLAVKPAGDLLIVRRTGSLDYLEGAAGDVDAEASKFTVDKDAITVPRDKTEGVIYFHPVQDELPEPTAKVVDVHGSTLFVRQIALAEGGFKITTPAGLVLTSPADALAAVDFSAGKIEYLSDLEPESMRYAPFFAPANPVDAVGQFYGLRRDIGFERAPLALDGKKYAKGLALASRTLVVYRLPGKFRFFKAQAGIDDSVGDGGNVRVEIKGDGKVIWEATVKGTEKSRPLDLDIDGVKRLEIFVDYGEDLDVADRFDLCEARVTK
jgi:hypothetical protein